MMPNGLVGCSVLMMRNHTWQLLPKDRWFNVHIATYVFMRLCMRSDTRFVARCVGTCFKHGLGMHNPRATASSGATSRPTNGSNRQPGKHDSGVLAEALELEQVEALTSQRVCESRPHSRCLGCGRHVPESPHPVLGQKPRVCIYCGTNLLTGKPPKRSNGVHTADHVTWCGGGRGLGRLEEVMLVAVEPRLLEQVTRIALVWAAVLLTGAFLEVVPVIGLPLVYGLYLAGMAWTSWKALAIAELYESGHARRTIDRTPPLALGLAVTVSLIGAVPLAATWFEPHLRPVAWLWLGLYWPAGITTAAAYQTLRPDLVLGRLIRNAGPYAVVMSSFAAAFALVYLLPEPFRFNAPGLEGLRLGGVSLVLNIYLLFTMIAMVGTVLQGHRP